MEKTETSVTSLKIFWMQIFHSNWRSSRRRCSVRKGVLWNFVKFTRKCLCQSLFFNKVAGLRPATLLKKRLWHMCFPVNFAKFQRTTFLTEHLSKTASPIVKSCKIKTKDQPCTGKMLRERPTYSDVFAWRKRKSETAIQWCS